MLQVSTDPNSVTVPFPVRLGAIGVGETGKGTGKVESGSAVFAQSRDANGWVFKHASW